METTRLSKAQRELLDEFKASQHADRYVSVRYRRTADILVAAGLLKRLTSGWYEITPAGHAR